MAPRARRFGDPGRKLDARAELPAFGHAERVRQAERLRFPLVALLLLRLGADEEAGAGRYDR